MIRRARSASARRIAEPVAVLPPNHPSSIALVTGWGPSGWAQYAKQFASDVADKLSAGVRVIAYCEGEYSARSVDVVQNNAPELAEFLVRNDSNTKRGLGGRGYNYSRDAMKFARKAFAFWSGYKEACKMGVDCVAWIDADVRIVSTVDADFLACRASADHAVTMLRRHGMHSETGWVAVNLRNSLSWEFVDYFIGLYLTDKLFTLPGWTDSHAFDAAAAHIGINNVYNLTPSAERHHHPFNIAFYPRIDHLKGEKRKRMGYSEHYAPARSRVAI